MLVMSVYMQGIHLTAYSPLGTPDSAAMQNRGDQTPHLMSDPAVKKIADKHGKHTAPVSLQHLLISFPICALAVGVETVYLATQLCCQCVSAGLGLGFMG